MTTAEPARARSRSRPVVLGAAVLLALSIVAAGAFGTSWALAATDSSIDLAATRDRVLAAGRQGIINFRSFDYQHVDRSLDRWEKSSTGPLHEAVVRQRKATAERISKTKSSADAEILDAALTELNVRAGKARMIAATKVTVTFEGKQPKVQRRRLKVELSRTDGGKWKLSAFGAVRAGP